MNPEVLMDETSGRLLFWPDAFHDILLTDLDQAIRWRQDTLRMFGRTLPLPRLTAWYGDPAAVYVYSGIRNEPSPWIDGLTRIKDRITELTGSRYNSVLANRYADGSQSMSWHADDEAALGPEPCIASVSLGATRRFLLKHKQQERRLELELPHGSLLLMAGRLQEEWVHALPRTRKPVGLRINLTFRFVHS
jgi:alkylated DNA repair dioxygenase AlkB